MNWQVKKMDKRGIKRAGLIKGKEVRNEEAAAEEEKKDDLKAEPGVTARVTKKMNLRI